MASTMVFPRLKELPKGLLQRILGGVGASADTCLEDRAPVPSSARMHLEYVDNFVVLGTDRAAVNELAQRGVEALRQKGLTRLRMPHQAHCQ